MSKRSLPYLDAWQELIDAGMERCLEFALEESEKGDAMRQSSPFVGILTEDERLGFLREWRMRRSGG